MADDIVQVILDAREDATSLSQFMYYPANSMVKRRLSTQIHSLNYYLDYLQGLELIYSQESGTVTVNGEEVKTVRQSINDSIDSVILGEYQTQLEVEVSNLSDDVASQKLDTGITATAKFGGVTRTQADKNSDTVSVKDFGAKGDGVTDDYQAIKSAIAYINIHGGVLNFPTGRYYTAYRNHSEISNWLQVTKSGVTFSALGEVTLVNFLIYVHGEYGSLQNIGVDFGVGATSIDTALSNSLKKNDYVQLLSGVNPYTADAGYFQLGSQNPTNLITPACRFAEIQQVKSVESSTSFKIYGEVIYPNYKKDTVGQASPITNVPSAQIRKLTPVKDIKFKGITFENTTNTSFREIVIRCAVNVTFESCNFESDSLSGTHVKSTDTLNLLFSKCKSNKALSGFSGSSWNSFVIGGCTQMVMFVNCTLTGEAQAVDVSPNMLATDVGFTPEINCTLMTSQMISFLDCNFVNCSDGFTTHPATYNLLAVGNNFQGGSTGIRVRNKRSTITGNTFNTRSAGIALSAFYDNCLIAGNTISKFTTATSTLWTGVSFSPLSSEVMNNNNVQNVVLTNNSFNSVVRSGDAAILMRNEGNGVPANESFPLFTTAIKTGLSNYLFKGNSFNGCCIKINKWVNGVSIISNSFSGGGGQSHYILSDIDSARHTVYNNDFMDSIIESYSLNNSTNPTFPYGVEHTVGFNYNTSINSISTTSKSLILRGGSDVFHDNLTVFNGGLFGSKRPVGTATALIDALPLDNTSDSFVRVFSTNTSTGNKYFDVYGNITTQNIYPRDTNAYTCGISSRSWSGGFTQTAFAVTSDKREKDLIECLDDAELRVAVKLKSLVRKYKYKSAINEKGDKARTHVGVIAQDVVAAFDEEGLNAYDYALLCHDTWADEFDDDGGILVAAGERFSIRYEELLAFIISTL